MNSEPLLKEFLKLSSQELAAYYLEDLLISLKNSNQKLRKRFEIKLQSREGRIKEMKLLKKKGQMGMLTGFVLSIKTVAIVLAVGLIVLSE